MKTKDVRNWLGIYFLLVTGVFGAYLLLFRESPLLPISKAEAVDSFQILLPVLLAQVTMIFRWFSGDNPVDDTTVSIPRWVVMAPPIMVVTILVVAVVTMIYGNLGEGKRWAPGPDTFKGVVTFCVSILNASSVFIVSKFFKHPEGERNVRRRGLGGASAGP